MSDREPIRNKDAISRKIENEVLILNQLTKQYHILNETAAIIWELSDGHHTIDQIAEAICRQYDDSVDIVREDVIQTIEGMAKLRLIDLE